MRRLRGDDLIDALDHVEFALAKKKQAGKGGRSGQDRSAAPAADYLWNALVENGLHILRMDRLCKDRGPIIVLYDRLRPDRGLP